MTQAQRIEQIEANMLFITPERKREKYISDAVYFQAMGKADWSDFIISRISNGISSNPGKRAQVILKWINSAEKLNATIVREEILKEFNT